MSFDMKMTTLIGTTNLKKIPFCAHKFDFKGPGLYDKFSDISCWPFWSCHERSNNIGLHPPFLLSSASFIVKVFSIKLSLNLQFNAFSLGLTDTGCPSNFGVE